MLSARVDAVDRSRRCSLIDAHDLGRAVREHRRALGMTQAQVAHRAGVSRRWWGELERGATHVELALVLRAVTEVGLALRLTCEGH